MCRVLKHLMSLISYEKSKETIAVVLLTDLLVDNLPTASKEGIRELEVSNHC